MSNQNPILTQILYQTYTIYQLNHRLRILKEYLENSYFTNTPPGKDLSTDDVNWLNSLPKSIFEGFDKDKVGDIFNQLKEEIKTLNPLVVYVPFELPSEELHNLANFLRTTFGENFLIDIKLDPSLIGGCALVWKGVYRDYSLRSKITEQNSEVFASFRNYLK